MFFPHQLMGQLLPEKTLCLTFDDGPGYTQGDCPGPKTIQLAQYLATQKIVATFFMVGKFMEQYPSIVAEVLKLGHIVGNHTYSRPDLQQLFKEGGDVVTEVKRQLHLFLNRLPVVPSSFVLLMDYGCPNYQLN